MYGATILGRHLLLHDNDYADNVDCVSFQKEKIIKIKNKGIPFSEPFVCFANSLMCLYDAYQTVSLTHTLYSAVFQ